MGRSLRPSPLVPRGFAVDDTAIEGEVMMIRVCPVSRASLCPGCGTRSERIHSRYQRLVDLPLAGKSVRLVNAARRFHCDAALCGRRIFAERFGGDVLAPWARRTADADQFDEILPLAEEFGA
jgi:transposase